ncbi:site-specific integrase [Pseudodesulfovibrio piezophilus]|uniref:Putative Phage integrase n=1 Tax=Pseudodesulfovibrio piezophilus (strain DSM 21447 / JCM 15486 / C1TLV30) TaxID=1322246 RepID=M1WQN9_PSEP2|nr:site-specific integrase [Pseudodesulfovibrio piezophilus]CCH47797.1 putative Phage integrase [Pseudodesulfovibrio piezophilus C1TLV30]
MTKPAYLFRSKTGLFYFRRKVPADLLTVYGGRKQIKRSLQTHDPQEAYELVRIEAVRSDQEFTEHRKIIKRDNSRRPSESSTPMSVPEMKRRALLMKQHMLEVDDELRVSGGFIEDEDHEGYLLRSQEQLDDIKQAYARGDVDAVKSHIREWTKNESDIPYEVSLEYMKALIEATEIQLARKQGEIILTPEVPPSEDEIQVEVPDQTPDKIKGNTLRSVFKKYVEERQPKGNTARDYLAHIHRFTQVLGVDDIALDDVTPTHIRTFKDVLVQLPARVPSEMKGMTVLEMVKAMKGRDDIAPLSAKTINDKALSALRAVYGYAVRNGYCDHNPAQGIKVEVSLRKQKAGSDRLPYSVEDMNKIFRFPVYTENDRPIGGKGEAAYWLPLLAAFTGARLEELGQITKDNVRKERGVHYIDLRELDEAKTENSKRRIPIHPELIKLGFLTYVKSIKSGRIFPDLQRGKDGKLTSSFSKWWGRYARQHGGWGKEKVFHSFRHAAKDGFREGDVAEDLRDELMGHAPRTVGESYGSGSSIKRLSEGMSRLTYPGLDLSHLTKW